MRLTEAEFADLDAKRPGGVTLVRAADAPLVALTFSLPWPPTVNTYWRHMVLGGKFKKARAQVLLSERGRDYRVLACASMNAQRVPRGALRGRLAVYATAYPPDRRQRDLDNLWKGVLDSLKHNGVISDDGDIDDLHVVRGAVMPEGRMMLRVSEIVHEPTPMDLPLGVDMRHEYLADLRKTLRKARQHEDKPIFDALNSKPPF